MGSYPTPETVRRCRATHTSRAVIWFWVSVPLLSVQTIETVPSVSKIASFLTSTPRCARRCAAIARDRVTVAGNPSGTAATRMPRASRNASNLTRPTSKIPTTKTIPAMPRATREMIRLICANSRCTRLGPSWTAWVRRAIRPNWVSMPVAQIIARPVPETTEVPAKTRLGRSSSLIPSLREASAVLRAGTASPVRLALLVRRPYSSTTRASAGILSPSANTSRSPGTSSLAGTRASVPPRTRRA